MKYNKIALASVIGGILSGCGADDQAYDMATKPANLVSKSQFKTDQVYLYMPSMARAPKYAVSMAPFMQGQEKLVTLSFEGGLTSDDKGGLKVTMISPDIISQDEIDQGKLGRWIEDQDSARPVLTIPGLFVDYQCKEDSYGDCTNVEEKVDENEVSWQARKFFLPDFADVQVHERSWNDLFTHADGCIKTSGGARLATDQNSNWKGYEVNVDGVINFEIEQDYQVTNSWDCMINALSQSNFDMSTLTFTVSQFYSLVPLDLVRSPSPAKTGQPRVEGAYEPIVYMRGDEDTFGFFSNTRGRPDPSYVDGQFDQNFDYLHRFNPNLDSIVYHLSDSFDLNEETRFFKQVTKDVVEKLNPQLAKVGVPTIILEEPSGKQSGDLRYNVINLIDEPLDNGLAGYGPSAVNPITGEIVHAHVNQYSGVLRSISDWLWDRIALDYNKGRVTPVESLVTTNIPATNTSTSGGTIELDPNASQIDDSGVNAERLNNLPVANETLQHVIEAFNEQMRYTDEDVTIEKMSAITELEKRMWAENNMYPVSAMRGGTTIKSLPTTIGGRQLDMQAPELWKDEVVGGKLKSWSELTEKKQEELSLLIVGVFYAKTLVHELGHNLGLRHNFKGSNDSTNYFKDSELAEHGLKTVPGYSSIMDYNPSLLNALPVFGPYDLAALRFGYKREVETTHKFKASSDLPSHEFTSVKQYDDTICAEVLDGYTRPSDLVYDGVVNALESIFEKDRKDSSVDTESNLRVFSYCTDGNVSLNEDCNRHDEGRNRDEIMAFKLETYDDLYYKRSMRGMKENFSESTISSYANRRINDFMDWRNSIHDFQRWKEFMPSSFQDDGYRIFVSKIDPYCSNEANKTEITYELYCGSPKAVESARDKLVDILITPDHHCELVDSSNNYSYQKLATVIDEWNYRNFFPINHVPQSCFDATVVEALNTVGLTVKGEIGRYLNSGSAPRPAPVNNYSNYIDYVGHWADKLAAAVALVDRVGHRNTTSRSTVALLDLPDVSITSSGGRVIDVKKYLLDTLILGTEDYSKMFKDSAGNYQAAKGDFNGITWEDKIEIMPYYGSYSIRNHFNIPRFQQVPLTKAILVAMVTHSAGNMVDQRDETFSRMITIRSDYPSASGVRSYKRKNGRTYYAAEENQYAWGMIEFTNEFEALQSAEANSIDLTTIPLNSIALADYQDADKKLKLTKLYNYQLSSLENLPVYNLVRDLDLDLTTH
ncbi:zinc-dependent metalloprotease [Vibrio tapetis]|uniref:MoxR-like ATPase n=1 Tax=Vibrio tapetis subsp. tapetis TaxID=1671868 RepID=A0A2N8ZB04_9VIBR|nr:zinc-dependent metalloprotease [Vibrio tapetis]SON49079.1 MoxR-like ATPase [Vibrio tapetis subsp. tapetis]